MGDVGNQLTDRQKYVNDPRIACKYGAKCYQKNPVHLQKYKHPPPKRVNTDATVTQPNKKYKTDDEVNTDESKTKLQGETCENSDDIRMKPEQQNTSMDDHEATLQDEKYENSDDIKTKPELQKVDITPGTASDSIDNNTIQISNLGRTPKNFDPKDFIKQKFLVEMPEDFYEFWNFCKDLKENSPQEALKAVGLMLVGPYDVLGGKFNDIAEQPDDNYLLHWRYYYDPPECQTVLKGDDKTGYHICYYRDSPKDLPVFLVSNCGNSDGKLKVIGDNIFAAVYQYLEDLKKTGDPFKKMNIGRFQNAIKKKAENLDLSLSERTQKIRDRDKKIVTRTFSKIGIVVPYNRKTQVGYRDLGVSNKELSKLLDDIQKALPEQRQKHLSKLQDILTNVSIATDECDFGAGIELGLDILAHGVDSLDQTISRFLATNYRLIDREAFAKIVEAHMRNRKKGVNLSIV